MYNLNTLIYNVNNMFILWYDLIFKTNYIWLLDVIRYKYFVISRFDRLFLEIRFFKCILYTYLDSEHLYTICDFINCQSNPFIHTLKVQGNSGKKT